jgi:hypothetical protein
MGTSNNQEPTNSPDVDSDTLSLQCSQHDVRRVFMARGGEAVTMAAAQATGACVKLLDSLMDLQQVRGHRWLRYRVWGWGWFPWVATHGAVAILAVQALLEQSGDAKVREFASSKAARKRPREAGAGGEQERYWKHIKLVSDEYVTSLASL